MGGEEMIATTMRRLRPRLWLGAALLCAAVPLIAAGPARAQGAPRWTIAGVSDPTNFAPGDNGDELILTAIDSGQGIADGATTPITITDTLPAAGVTLAPAGVSGAKGGFPSGAAMTCQSTPTIACTTTEAIIPGDVLKMVLTVDVAANAPATVSNQVSIEGGGAPEASATAPITVSATPAGFGLAHGSPLAARSSTDAGAHPTFTTAFSLSTKELDTPGGAPKDLALDFPPGVVAQADSFPQCSLAEVTAATCPREAVLGRAFATVQASPGEPGALDYPLPIYNVAPDEGEPAALAFDIPGHSPVRLDLGFAPSGGYHLRATIADAEEAQPLLSTVITLWGVPADLNGAGPSSGFGGPGPGPRLALLTNPTSCGADPLSTALSLDAWADPGVELSAAGSLAPTGECALPGFAPTIVAQPDTTVADSPAGLLAEVNLPQNEEPDGTATADLEQSVFALPRGLVPNPAVANGLAACGPAQIGLGSEPGVAPPAFTADPAGCPPASKLGSVQIETPLFDQPLPGSVFLAKPFENPFGSLLAIYIAVEDPVTGTVVKLAGRVEPDPSAHRLITSFDQIPQLPFENARFELSGGPHAALRTPPVCGSFATTTDLTPWTSPTGADTTPSDPFQIASGAGGSGCQASAAALPNKPGFQAGTASSQAAAYSPFDFKLSREDGSQELAKVDLTLPKGLIGKLAGIPYCSDAQIAAAAAPPQSAAGAVAPSCPPASQLGTVTADTGAGPDPLQVQGKAYLAGPYEGAPISLAIVVPAIAGPFDLGNVVVRSAFHIDPESVQVTVTSDPFPTELQGIPLDVRSVDVDIDRADFIVNPTNCDPKSVLGTAVSVFAQSAPLSYPFPVTGCAELGFRPKFALNLKGGTRRGDHPALSVSLTAPTGPYANFTGGVVVFPHSEFIDQGHIRTVCTRVQFAAHECPSGSIYGHAKLITPLLGEPFEGPVYLRSSDHTLPDLVSDLRTGGGIETVVDGRVDSVHGDLRTTVEGTPDAALSSYTLEMQGGRRGLLVNSQDLCGSVHRAYADFSAQNGKTSASKPVVTNSCPKKRHHKKKRGDGHGKKSHHKRRHHKREQRR
jgi:hypothetical protein